MVSVTHKLVYVLVMKDGLEIIVQPYFYNVPIIVIIMVSVILKLVYVPVMNHGLDRIVEPDSYNVL
jgi:hypothetical protein